MSRRAGTLAAVGILALACTDTARVPTGADLSPSFSHDGTCDFGAIAALVRDEFAPPEQNAVIDLVQLMEDAVDPLRTSRGFDVMAAISAGLEAGTLTGDAETGDHLSKALIACMNVESSVPLAELDFTRALEPGTRGTYEVRGLGPAEASVFARIDAFSAVAPPTGTDFQVWLGAGARALFYGWVLQPTEEFRTEAPQGAGYEWAVVRTNTGQPLSKDGFVGICAGSPGSGTRLQHAATIAPVSDPLDDIPGWSDLPIDCSEIPGLAAAPSTGLRSWLARGLYAGFRWLRPAPVMAVAARGSGSGSTAGSFSPFGGVLPNAVTLSFENNPVNTTINTVLKDADGDFIQVRASGEGGTDWEGVRIRITALTNKGVNVAPLGCGEADTNEDGIATFPKLYINKAGGYKLIARTVPPSTDPDVQSFDQATSSPGTAFNLKNAVKTPPTCD
jgi:hypothetical protein